MTHDHWLVRKRSAISYWEEQPWNRPVKISPLFQQPSLWAEGYITC
jgi:hypothetical protein